MTQNYFYDFNALEYSSLTDCHLFYVFASIFLSMIYPIRLFPNEHAVSQEPHCDMQAPLRYAGPTEICSKPGPRCDMQ